MHDSSRIRGKLTTSSRRIFGDVFYALVEKVPNHYQGREEGEPSPPYMERKAKWNESVSLSWEAQEQEKHRWYRTDLSTGPCVSVCPEHVGQPCDTH